MNAVARPALLLLVALLSAAHAEDRKAAPPAAESAPTVSLPATTPEPAPINPASALTTPTPAASAAPAADATITSVTPPAGEKAGDKSAPAKNTKDDKKAAAKNLAPPPLSPRFLQVRDRVKVLYGSRDETRPAPDPRYNPFRTPPVAPVEPVAVVPAPGASKDSVAPTPPPVPAVTTNVAQIKQAVALLKVTGFVERDGRILLNINQALYKEGDTVKVTLKGQSVLLRIKKLTRTSLTLTLGDAETTLNF